MNREELKTMKLLEETLRAYEEEVKAKDSVIQLQKEMIGAQEHQISELTSMLREILKPWTLGILSSSCQLNSGKYFEN